MAEGSAGYAFQHASIKATLDPRAEKVKGLYYRQTDDAPSPAIINLYASDIVELSRDFSAPSVVDVLAVTGKRNTKKSLLYFSCPCLTFSLYWKGGAITIYPQDKQFKAWDFIHYLVSTENNTVKRTVTFVQTTIAEGKQTASGYWTVDQDHARSMKNSMKHDDVVGKVLSALGVDVDSLCYDEIEKEFIAKTKKDEDTVQFVLMTSSPLPVRTGKPDHGNTNKDMRNLIVVHRSEVERLGIVFSE